MDKTSSKIEIELLTDSGRETIPRLLDVIFILGFFGMFLLMILQKNNINFSTTYFETAVIVLLVSGLMCFMINVYGMLYWDINKLRKINGEIKLTEFNIEINDSLINLEDIKKIDFKVYSIRGGGNRGLGDGSNNEIRIITSTSEISLKFIIESRKKRDLLKNYALFLKAKKTPIFIDGIDLK